MSDDDSSSSEDIDYKPSTKEIKEAEAEEKRLKRQKTAHPAATDAIAEVRNERKQSARPRCPASRGRNPHFINVTSHPADGEVVIVTGRTVLAAMQRKSFGVRR